MPGWLAPAIAIGQTVASAVGAKKGQERQHDYNMQLARYQSSANERYLDKQLAYDTPANQMARYKAAGLNPNLIYGQGTPGNQSTPLKAPDYRNVDMAKNILGDSLGVGMQSMLMQSQISAIDANTVKAKAQSSLTTLQAQVLAKNPLMDPAGYNAIIEGLKATAESKEENATLLRRQNLRDWRARGNELTLDSAAGHKIELELNLLEQKFNLGTTDQKIKAEILNSKQFQNAILEVQKRFMTEADITPQHILQFIQLLLMKLL